MRLLTGKNAKFYIRIDGEFHLVMCAIQVTFQFDHEEVLKTSRTSGKWVERESRLCDWGVSASGLSKINNSDGQISFFWLVQASVIGTEQFFKIVYTDDDGNNQTVSGNIIIKQGQFSSLVGSFSTANVFFPGTGAFSTEAVTGFTVTDIYKKYFTTTPGAFEVTLAELGGATEIMLVLLEEGQYTETSGAPVALASGRQFKFTDNTTDGKLTFHADRAFNPGEVGYVQYRKPI